MIKLYQMNFVEPVINDELEFNKTKRQKSHQLYFKYLNKIQYDMTSVDKGNSLAYQLINVINSSCDEQLSFKTHDFTFPQEKQMLIYKATEWGHEMQNREMRRFGNEEQETSFHAFMVCVILQDPESLMSINPTSSQHRDKKLSSTSKCILQM